MKIDIDLSGATSDQKARFSEPRINETLDAIRETVGDRAAQIKVSWAPGKHRTFVHMVQSLADLEKVYKSASAND